jgi:phospholipase/carboxylesterase
LNVYIKDPHQQAKACVIWMHGLGADAQDMAHLAEQLPLTVDIRHVFVDAPIRPVTMNNRMPMRAWYDILGLKISDREDREGVKASECLIREIIDQQVADGFETKKIFLAGFSQGGAMALYTGLHTTTPLAGVIALSSYLPLATECNIVLDQLTPLFIAGGSHDPVVRINWTKECADNLRLKGFDKIAWHEYPMDHSICMEEINDLSRWLNKQVHLIVGESE